MGKKKVVQKSGDTVSETEKAGAAKTVKSSKHRYENGKIFIQASYNNTLITVTDDKGNAIAWLSAGSLGFSGPKKSTPFAASKVAEAIMQKIQNSGPFNVEILVKGVGNGRDSAVRSFAAAGLNILSVKDVTPVPHNGPRPPKTRRV